MLTLFQLQFPLQTSQPQVRDKPHLFSNQWTLSDLIVDFQFFFRLTFSKSVCKWFCSLLSSKFLVLLSRTARKCKFYLSLVIISIDVWLRYSRETSSTIRIHNCSCEVLLTMQILIAYIFIRLNAEITCTLAEFAGELLQLPTKKWNKYSPKRASVISIYWTCQYLIRYMFMYP